MQTDNAGSENKNFYVIGLLALLVHWNWFDLVLHVLLQGHTHTLDDSTNFAVSNPALKKAQLRSMFDLLTVENESHSKRVPDPSDPSGQKRPFCGISECLPNRARQGHGGGDSFLVQGLRLASELAWRLALCAARVSRSFSICPRVSLC